MDPVSNSHPEPPRRGDSEPRLPDGLEVMVACGMIEKKLRQKLAPIQAIGEVRAIHLLRRKPFEGTKIVCHSPPPWVRSVLPMAELWRMGAALGIGVRHRPAAAVAMTLLPHGLHAALLRGIFGVPLIHHIMGKQDLGRHRLEPTTGQQLRWWFACRADAIVTRGEATRREFVERGGYAPEAVQVQHNVFDFQTYAPDPSRQPEYDLVYVGNLAPYKRVDWLLRVAAGVKARLGQVRLAIAGDGPLREALRQQADDLGMGEDVAFLGRLEEPELVDLLRRSRVFAMTSPGEGLAQALIEAMACGVPPVVFDDADVREVAVDGENAMLVPTGDVDGFTEAVVRILSEDGLRERIRDGALQLRTEHAERFSLAEQTRVWRRVLARAMQRRGRLG
jgi:glycosyltransferase involved in cell wall biosynthesis